MLNLQLMPTGIHGAFYWFTYGLIWILPIAGLYLGIREKDRALLDVSLLITLGTLLTNKAHLGWTRHEWDPIVLRHFPHRGCHRCAALAFGGRRRATKRIHRLEDPEQGIRRGDDVGDGGGGAAGTF